MDLMRSVSTMALAIGASIVVGAVAPVHAETELFSLQVGPRQVSPDSTVLSFDRFNPALGTLTGVVFSLANDQVSTNARTSGNFSGGEGGTSTGRTQSTFEILPEGLFALFQESGEAISTCTSEISNCSNPNNTSETTSDFAPLSRTIDFDLANYTDNGVDQQFSVTVELGAITQVFSCFQGFPFAGADCTAGGGAIWQGSLSVAFEFERNVDQVPAPATLALLGASLIALGAARRRRA